MEVKQTIEITVVAVREQNYPDSFFPNLADNLTSEISQWDGVESCDWRFVVNESNKA